MKADSASSRGRRDFRAFVGSWDIKGNDWKGSLYSKVRAVHG